MSSHFENQDVASHIVQKRSAGVFAHSESHGAEIPGHFSAAADAIRESALIYSLLWLPMTLFHFPLQLSKMLFLSFACGWLVWKTGRSAWLGWSRLWRLHRVIEQEKYEIEHNRSQERQELTAMYRLKGFEGKLLEDVIDVLTADGDRLLKVMLEEELGLTLEAYQHPLKQAFGAFLGASFATFTAALFLWFAPPMGVFVASALLVTLGATISAIYEKNNIISTIVWNLGIGSLGVGTAYFILNLFIVEK